MIGEARMSEQNDNDTVLDIEDVAVVPAESVETLADLPSTSSWAGNGFSASRASSR
jgi:hypothetical protein